MSKDNDLKLQRDRFLGFAFAGGDLLLEINQAGTIIYASGAIKFFIGVDEQSIIGKSFISLFIESDADLLDAMRGNRKAGVKQGPYFVTIKNAQNSKALIRVFLTSFMLEPAGSIFFTISNGAGFLRVLDSELEGMNKKQIASSKDFEIKLQTKIPELMAKGEDIDVKLLELGGLSSFRKNMDNNSWDSLMESISQTIMDSSLDGDMATALEGNKYVVVQKKGDENAGEALEKKLEDIARQYVGDKAINLITKTVDGQLPALTSREASRAILYTINKMEADGINAVGDNLKDSFAGFLLENTNNIKNLKHVISHQLFWVCFQPIVDLKTRKVLHHEVLTRFEGNASPYGLIVLAEDIGISPDVDLSVCRQTIKFLDQNKKRDVGELAVNLSGASVQNEAFIDSLNALLKQYPSLTKHIAFEITESSGVKNFEMVNNFIQQLRKDGHKVYLDDFGAGAASFQYIHKLHVDAIKIDGAYTKTVLDSPRDATLIKNLTQMAHDLDILVVSEMIETEAQAQFLQSIGVDKGQGWLFGKAERDIKVAV